MQNILIYMLAAAIMLVSGCVVHKPDVQQGNILEPEVLAQLRIGLTKKQVQFLMGTPIIEDTFHPDRWDYVYWLKVYRHKPVEHRVTVFFENNLVTHLETVGITLPPPASPAVPVSPKTPETGLVPHS